MEINIDYANSLNDKIENSIKKSYKASLKHKIVGNRIAKLKKKETNF